MTRARTALIGTLLIAAACTSGGTGGDEPASTTPTTGTPAPPTPTTTSTTAPETTSTTRAFDWLFTPESLRPTVILLDAGADPRAVRSYSLVKGTFAEASMRLATSIDQEIDGIAAPSASTSVDMAFTVEVTDVVADGFVVVSTFGDFQVRASASRIDDNLDSVYASLIGTSTTQLVAPTGEVVAVARTRELDELGEIASALAGAAPPLPVEPIGVGAKWRIVAAVEAQGVSVVQTSTYTLLAVEGPLLTVAVESEQVLGPDGVNIPGLEDLDADATLSGSGAGQAVWDMSSPVPATSTIETVQVLTLTATFAGEESTLEQTTTFSLKQPSPGPLAPPEGTVFIDMTDTRHTTETVDYQQDPPAGGAHAPVWQNCGFYDEPISREAAVHSLEHGAVWITYQPELPTELLDELRVHALQPYTLVSPYPGLDDTLVASAWGAQLRLDSVSDKRLAEFVGWFAAGPQTPEPGAPCLGGTGTPQLLSRA